MGVIGAASVSAPPTISDRSSLQHYDGPWEGVWVARERNLCIVRGLAQANNPGGISARPRIGTLPPNCRPRERLVFNVNNHSSTARVDVLPDGLIAWVDGGKDWGWLSLSGILFVVE